MSDPEAFVRQRLADAGLPASDEEVAALARNVAVHRELIERLYALPESRYQEPALIFQAEPSFGNWRS